MTCNIKLVLKCNSNKMSKLRVSPAHLIQIWKITAVTHLQHFSLKITNRSAFLVCLPLLQDSHCTILVKWCLSDNSFLHNKHQPMKSLCCSSFTSCKYSITTSRCRTSFSCNNCNRKCNKAETHLQIPHGKLSLWIYCLKEAIILKWLHFWRPVK